MRFKIILHFLVAIGEVPSAEMLTRELERLLEFYEFKYYCVFHQPKPIENAAELIVAANWKALRQLSRRQQIVAVWAELFALLMLFFYSFDLSFAFIAKKIGFLVSQGVVTTLYISAISIVIATVIALAGAIAAGPPRTVRQHRG